MSDSNWWTAWGQSGAAIAGFVTGAVSLFVSFRTLRINREKHAWEKADRERDAARKRWCEEQRARMELLGRGAPVEIPAGEVAWAKWGEEQGLLRVRERSDGKWFLFRL